MIDIQKVSFAYSQGEESGCLKDITLQVAKGETVLLCGESGCGKTTVTRLINGLIPHYYEGRLTGTVTVNGIRASTADIYDTAALVGSVFQNPRSQFFNVNTTGELAFGAENRGMAKEDILQRIEQVADQFKVRKLLNRSLFKLSGGEKQQIACASISVTDNEIVVLDEPSSNLDAHSIHRLRDLLQQWKKQGKTLVIAEHRLFYLRELADRVIYMKDGRIERQFTNEEIKRLTNSQLAELGLRPLDYKGLRIRSKHSMRNERKLQLRNFRYCYKGDKKPALEIEALEIPRHGIIALIGRNGAGKSTFVRCLCGLEKSCKGLLVMDNRELDARKRLEKSFMVMQDVNHQLFTESVLDEILLSMKSWDESRAKACLDRFDLLAYASAHPMSLSGGQKQRVAIASAVSSEGDVIFFDEPTSGLDLRHMRQVAGCLQGLMEQGKTVFLITHDLELIYECCTDIIMLEEGRVAASFPLDRDHEGRVREFFLELPADNDDRNEETA